jgi:hypothetical protein
VAVVLVKLLCKGAICAHILCNDANISIGIFGDGVGDALEGGRVAGVCSGRDARDKVLEERKRYIGDCDRSLLLPDVDSIVELLCRGESSEIPGVSVIVDVFNVSSNSDGTALRDALVDVPRAERVGNRLVVGKGFVTAWLESGSITAKGRVEVVD